MWQDAIFSIGMAVFALSLLPAIIERQYPPVSTCIITTIVIIIFGIADATLGLWVAAVLSAVNAFLWLYMALRQLTS